MSLYIYDFLSKTAHRPPRFQVYFQYFGAPLSVQQNICQALEKAGPAEPRYITVGIHPG